MASRGATIACALLLIGATAVGGADRKADKRKPGIADLQLMRSGGAIRLSFQLVDAFDDSVRERIDSGLPTGFLYESRLERVRKWWFNGTAARSRLEVVAMYNAVTREYLVNTKLDGRLIDSRVFTTRPEVETAMSTVHDVLMFDVDEAVRGRFTVRVRAKLGSRTLLTLFPTTVNTEWADSEPFRLGGADESSQ